MVKLIKHDLEFILQQILISEQHATREDLNGDPVSGTPLTDLIVDPLLPYGLRTVDGTYNNIIPGREDYGAADQGFPRLLDPEYTNDADGDSFDANGPAPGGEVTNTDYAQPGDVADADPRTISNLIADQTSNNPAALAAYLEALESGSAVVSTVGQDGIPGTADDTDLFFLPNVAPDEGLSSPFNSWMTLFGQFFDHGLDLVAKGGNGTVFIPLQPDDPLYVPGGHTNFMVLTRVSTDPGPDGVLGTSDDVDPVNSTTPFVDQNQTYTSHSSHQVFLREYELNADGVPVATGQLLDGSAGGLATWADVKAQARTLLGIELTDADVTNVPLLATDEYGRFLRGPNGYAQLVMPGENEGDPPRLVEGDPNAPISTAGAFRTGHAFLDDIAHAANPVGDHDGNPATPPGFMTADGDDVVGNVDGAVGTYDDELLDAHYITGDGRGNENIGLTAVHHIFHSEHNRQIEEIKQIILDSGDPEFVAQWQLPDGSWNGERLFQAGRFVTEMQYQHLVFEEFARKVQPDVDAFVFEPSIDIDAAIVAEFAHVVYRFGHSMLTETVARTDAEMNTDDMGLIEAFLNPTAFAVDANGDPISADAAAGAIVRGMTRQVGNEIDEFVTDALRNNLLGLPLDLPAINIARGRDTGIPTLNHARAQFFEATQDTQLKPYVSWIDFALNLKNPASILNFIAAYGTHDLIAAAETLEEKREAANKLVFGDSTLSGQALIDFDTDRAEFLNSTGAWADQETGLNLVDFWIGGLAEKKMAFGGMLGSTFSFVFEFQLEQLQDGDRFYYLSRAQGLNLLNELENNSFAELAMRNTDLGEPGSSHLPGDLFAAVSIMLEIDQSKQVGADPTWGDPLMDALSPLVVRGPNYLRYNGDDHVVLGGTEGDDVLIAGGGDDTVWGDGGNDIIEGGYGVDHLHGGDGDDIITNSGTDIGETDFIHGDAGNDVIHGGSGLALVFGGDGSDFIIGGPDGKEVFGGTGDDFIYGGDGGDFLLGNEGDDWIEGGGRFDTLAGENSELFFNSTIVGHDVLNGGSNDTDYDAESGDDIMFQSEGIQRNEGMFGFDWAIHKDDPLPANSDLRVPIFTTVEEEILRDRFDMVEGLSGWIHDDRLTGDDRSNVVDGGADGDFTDHELTQEGVDRIDGLREMLDVADSGNPTDIAFTGGNMLIGGGGSDIIEGRGGDDFIDGDSWLNVRLVRVDENGNEVETADSMLAYADRMFSGEISPADLRIVREILDGSRDGDIDTAVFSDVLANYDITYNENGTITVAHTGAANPNTSDGTDTLRNIERLQFSDGTLVVNLLPTGTVTISDQTPTERGLLVASHTIADANGLTNAQFTFTWQASANGVAWTDVGVGDTFFPGQNVVGMQLRVVVSYVDDAGYMESVVSAPTAVVGDFVALGGGAQTDSGTAGDDIMFMGGGADTAFGLAGNDMLYGENGRDFLDGGAGDDVMVGGGGNDTFVVDSVGDTVVEDPGQGTDTVQTTLNDYALPDNVENLVFTGAGDFVGVGNELDNRITGGDGNDSLDGGTGVDRLRGGAGDDNYFVDDSADLVLEGSGAGTDSVFADVATYSLRGNVENLTYVGTGDFTGTGNGLGNTITGGAGDDILDGVGGSDTVIGGAGNDTLLGGLSSDTFVFAAGFGNDTIQDFVSSGGQRDFLDVSALNITAADFVDAIDIVGDGADTVITVGTEGTIRLTNVSTGTVNQNDFLFSV